MLSSALALSFYIAWLNNTLEIKKKRGKPAIYNLVSKNKKCENELTAILGPALPERDLQKMEGRKIAFGHGLSNS